MFKPPTKKTHLEIHFICLGNKALLTVFCIYALFSTKRLLTNNFIIFWFKNTFFHFSGEVTPLCSIINRIYIYIYIYMYMYI
jgi:hypothetical protein